MRRLSLSVIGIALAAATLVANPATADESVVKLPDLAESQRAAPKKKQGVQAQAGGATPIKKSARISDVASSSAPNAAQRATNIIATQDLVSGKTTATVTLAATPNSSQDALVRVAFGNWSGNACQRKFVVGGTTYSNAIAGGVFTNNTPVAGSRNRSGNVVTFTTVDNSTVAKSNWNCAWADISTVDGSTAYQTFYAEDLNPSAYRYSPIAKTQVKGSKTRSIAKGKWTKVKVKVTNAGKAAGKFNLKANGPRLAFKPKKIKIGKLAAGRSVTKAVKVKLKKGQTSKATFKAKTSGSTSKASAQIFRKVKLTKPGSLAGRYFWGFKTGNYSVGWDNVAVMFVDKKWAYMGFPPKGTPKCSAGKKKCVRYSYSKGKVKIGSQKGTVNSKGLTLKKKKTKQFYYPLTVPKKGTKFKVALVHKDFDGCFPGLYCRTWTERLSMAKNGRFVRSKTTLSSFGVPGSQTFYAGASPDEKGTYKVLSRGRIQFRYLSGKVKTETIGIEQNQVFKPAPQAEGLVIGKTNFYPN